MYFELHHHSPRGGVGWREPGAFDTFLQIKHITGKVDVSCFVDLMIVTSLGRVCAVIFSRALVSQCWSQLLQIIGAGVSISSYSAWLRRAVAVGDVSCVTTRSRFWLRPRIVVMQR